MTVDRASGERVGSWRLLSRATAAPAAEPGDQRGVGAGKALLFFAAVASAERDRHRITGSGDHAPGPTELLPTTDDVNRRGGLVGIGRTDGHFMIGTASHDVRVSP